jgi:hypothetical protein
LLAVEFVGDVRLVIFGNLRKLLGDVDLLHRFFLRISRWWIRFTSRVRVAKKLGR